jgi:hypothetical protein
MRQPLILALATTVLAGAATAQTSTSNDPANNAAANANATVMAPKAQAGEKAQTGEKQQPQGATGPINTTSGGAPPTSPQGDSPPGMQPMPQDSQQAATPTNLAPKAQMGEKNQPQGSTGPLNTTSGGTPPTSPQGDSPPGMQPRPKDPQPRP